MTNISEAHLHHMAKRHHATMRKLEGLRSKFSGITERFIGTIEVGAGAWLGGLLEGRTNGGTLLHVPLNLAVGAGLLVAGHLDLAGAGHSAHLNNLGNGFVGSYVAATGYAFGKRWRDTGKLFGHAKAAQPLPPPAAVAPPVAAGDPSPEQMAAILSHMRAAQQAAG